ncbi:MAG TPA: efflux RND transporter periplasmic adaptor subunit [Steroidobacteraceae bacterium]|nr:efflux RND transporter periplasmic adaptor subunit [Steroidobacteraceae bacterium]
MHHLAFFGAGMRIVAVLTSAFILAACGEGNHGQQPAGGAAVPVSTMTVATKRVPLMIETVGRAEGSKAVEIRARVTGILEKQSYSEGEKVKAGQLLFQIEASPFEIALAHSRAALAEEQARNQQAKRNSERLTSLAKANAVSRRVADDAISAVESSDAALLAAQANVREAELNLSYTKVTAPISGITGRALHSEGSLVNAGTDSSLLTTLTQADPMWVRFALSEGEFGALREAEGKTASLSVALLQKDGAPRPGEGKVNFSASTIDESLGTVQLRAEFANAQLVVLPGEYVRVRLTGGARDAITVPQKAVLQNANGPYVWVVSTEGQAQQRTVKTGSWVGAEWQINEGLQQGDTVIVDNLLKLKPGQPVQAKAIDSGAAPESANADAQSAKPASTARGAG